MAALTTEKIVTIRAYDNPYDSKTVASGNIIYQGAFVGSNAGAIRGLVAGDKFVGLAENSVDNTAGTEVNTDRKSVV